MEAKNSNMKVFQFWHIDWESKWLLERINESYHVKPGYNKGDLIFRMSLYALITGDAQVIKACIKLVNAGMRWPDSLVNDADSKNRLQYWWGRWMHKRFGAPQHRYGPRHNISRDCCIMIIAATYWHQWEMIQDIKIPWKINRPQLYHWFEYLKTSKPIHKAKYEQWQSFSIDLSVAFKFPSYSKHLMAWMAFIAKSDTVKVKLLQHVPWWNLLIRCLCGDDTVSKCQVDLYIANKGYLWTSSDLPTELNRLGPDEPAYIDRDILYFAYENRNF